MHRLLSTLIVVAFSAAPLLAQTPAAKPAAKPASAQKAPLVEFEMMTWPEVKAALEAGKTTALVYTGGTEQRGPQNVNGGHTLMGREIVKTIALRLGNAIAMPVLPYTPNNASASPARTTPARAKSPWRRDSSRIAEGPLKAGNHASASSSSAASDVSKTPVNSWSAAITRCVRRDTTVTFPPSASSIAGSSEAGSAWARLPHTVPRLRMTR